MKLLRFGEPGREQPGILGDDGRIRDLSHEISDISGGNLTPAGIETIRDLDRDDLPVVEDPVRLGPCVAGIGKIVCIGLNYSDHAAEAGMDIPSEPVVFMKATSALCGPDDPIVLPRDAQKVDWEAELAIVIGKPGKYIDEAQALDHVAGYSIMNDVSERSYQLERGGQWVKGKSADSFAPLGPWLVTPNEIRNPQDLGVWLKVDGDSRQNSTTGQMIFGVAEIISYLSRFMSLHPGDVIATGTPAGVGLGMKPPQFLRPGNRVTLGIDGLGEQSHDVVAEG